MPEAKGGDALGGVPALGQCRRRQAAGVVMSASGEGKPGAGKGIWLEGGQDTPSDGTAAGRGQGGLRGVSQSCRLVTLLCGLGAVQGEGMRPIDVFDHLRWHLFGGLNCGCYRSLGEYISVCPFPPSDGLFALLNTGSVSCNHICLEEFALCLCWPSWGKESSSSEFRVRVC